MCINIFGVPWMDVKSVTDHVVSYLNKQSVTISREPAKRYNEMITHLLEYVNVAVSGLIMEYGVVDHETLLGELHEEVAKLRGVFFKNMCSIQYDFKKCAEIVEQISIKKEPSLATCEKCKKDISQCSFCGQRVYNNYWLFGQNVVTCYYRFNKHSPCSIIADSTLYETGKIVKIEAHCICRNIEKPIV